MPARRLVLEAVDRELVELRRAQRIAELLEDPRQEQVGPPAPDRLDVCELPGELHRE